MEMKVLCSYLAQLMVYKLDVPVVRAQFALEKMML
jgi:hypothetical protein